MSVRSRRSRSSSYGRINEPSIPREEQKANELKWKKWWTRTFTTLWMIAGFLFVVYMGHWALVATVILLSILGFREISTLMHLKADTVQLPFNDQLLTWYWFALVSYAFHGRTVIKRYGDELLQYNATKWLPQYHAFVAFCGFVGGFVLFVLLLQKGKYKAQFKQLAFTWMALFLAVIQATFWASNTLDGLFWIMFPASLVICNDVMAYVFGFFFGKTPLIKLSPKKTWEGFIGGGISTLVWAVVFASFLARFDAIVCPRVDIAHWPTTCVRNPVFDVQQIDFPEELSALLSLVGVQASSIVARPIIGHALLFAAFASLIAPFGGFFASGFKRAFNLKDFADTIPGHGGILDRMDCQFTMGTWTAIYLRTFISPRATLAVVTLMAAQLSRLDQQQLIERVSKMI